MSAFKRTLRRYGEDWVLNGWASSTRDQYEDELATQPTSVTFKAIRKTPLGAESEQRDEKGQTRWEKLDLIVDADLQLPPQTNNGLPVTLTSPDGRDYDLVGVDKAGAVVGSKRLQVMTGGADAALYL